MRRAFGDDENIGLLFRNIEGCHRDVRPVLSDETLVAAHMPPSTSVRFAPLKSVLTTSGKGDITVPDESYSMKFNIWQSRLEICSCFLSLFCLLGVIIVWIVQNSINIELTRNIQFSSLNTSFLDNMRLWQNAVTESCAGGSFDLIVTQPPWTNEDKQKFHGLSIDATIHASYINLTAVAFFIYVFSALFQGIRFVKFQKGWSPKGPEFSRWLEYAFTSPLQVVLVALSFRITNIDVILGYFGMQLAMVLMGYSIEKQTNKRYLNSKDKISDKFYYVDFLGDIRGPVYILVSWLLHFLIWGLPGWWHSDVIRWGISGQYAYIHKYQQKCGDKNFQMPAFVDVIFFSQFICFILFGVVCTIQYLLSNQITHDGLVDFNPKTIKDSEDYKLKWGKYSLAYAILSVTAKTFLEIGFLGLVATSPEFLKEKPVPTVPVALYSNVTQLSLFDNSTLSVPKNTTCYSIGMSKGR